MKFDLGQWMLQPNTEALFPRTVTDVRLEDDALILMGYNHHVHGRSSFIHGTLITARFSSPMPDVIRVQLWHHKGKRERQPSFDLDYSLNHAAAEIGSDENSAWLKGGEWRFNFHRDDVLLTESENKAVSLFIQNDKTYLREQLSMRVGETIYGLGERFGAFVKNGTFL